MFKSAHNKFILLDEQNYILCQSQDSEVDGFAPVSIKLNKYGRRVLYFKHGKNTFFIKDIYDNGKINFSFSDQSNLVVTEFDDYLSIGISDKFLSAKKDDTIGLAPHLKGWEKFKTN